MTILEFLEEYENKNKEISILVRKFMCELLKAINGGRITNV